MNPADPDPVVIIGGGQAGLQAAVSLRRRGYRGKLALVGDEAYPPYQRPPLSKTYLKDAPPPERLFLKPREYYAGAHIDMSLGVRVERIDPKAARVFMSDGRHAPYSRLIVATGAVPRHLDIPGAALDGVMVLRGLDDALALGDRLRDARRMVVVGGGYIGLEVAASARALGVEVAILERAPRLLARAVGPRISAFFSDLHEKHGVGIRCGVELAEIEGAQGRVEAARLSDGAVVPADLVLLGVGAAPATALAVDAGLDCDDGILVDAHCRTSDEAIYAVGDCARRPWTGESTSVRLESVQNAIDMGERAAAAIVGDAPLRDEPPWFWSDQYDVKLQTAGLSAGCDETIYRKDSNLGGFSAFRFRRDRLIAVEAVNEPSAFLAGKALLRAGGSVDARLLADQGVSLKSIVSLYSHAKATA